MNDIVIFYLSIIGDMPQQLPWALFDVYSVALSRVCVHHFVQLFLHKTTSDGKHLSKIGCFVHF